MRPPRTGPVPLAYAGRNRNVRRIAERAGGWNLWSVSDNRRIRALAPVAMLKRSAGARRTM